MADQNLKINVGTSYNGEGIAKASAAVGQLGKVVDGTQKQLTNMATGLGMMSGEAAKLPGNLGKAAGSLGNFLSMLSSGPGAISAFIAAMGMLGVSLGQKIFGPIRDAQREFRQLLKDQDAIAKNTHELYDKWRKKWADDKEKADKKAKEAAEKRKKENDGLNSALAEQWTLEQKLLKTEREIEKTRNEGEWDKAIAASDSPYDKKILEAQKSAAMTEIGGKNRLADAESNISAIQRDLNIWGAKSASDAEAKIRFENAQKQMDLAVAEYNRTFEEVTNANTEAARKVKEVIDEVEKAKEEEKKFNRKQIDEIRAQGKANDQRSQIQDKISAIDKKLLGMTKDEENRQKIRDRRDKGAALDNERHSGISGGGYQYSRDENGNMNRFDQFRRAQRYARNNDHVNDGGDGDNVQKNNQDKATRLQRRLNSGKSLSKQDQQWLNDWNAFNNQNNVQTDQLTELKEIKNKLIEALGVK